MAILLNLLAEEQHTEEIRRRDPVRRALVGSGIIVGVALGCSLVLKLISWQASEELIASETHWKRLENENRQLTDARRKTIDIERKLRALQLLAQNRFLWGSILNALQECVVDRIQVTSLRADHTYTVTKPAVARDKEKEKDRKTVGGTNVTEKIVLNIEARDFSNTQFSKFQEAISSHPYLRGLLTNGTVRLASLSPPNKSEGDALNRDHTIFKVEVAFPQVVRSEAK
jgi:hypothetical protein